MTITIETAKGKVVRQLSQEKAALSQILQEAGLPGLDMPCGGRGVCGKCRVIASGALSAPTPQELRLRGGLYIRGKRYCGYV